MGGGDLGVVRGRGRWLVRGQGAGRWEAGMGVGAGWLGDGGGSKGLDG